MAKPGPKPKINPLAGPRTISNSVAASNPNYQKSYMVQPVGPRAASQNLGLAKVVNCCDESEAIRLYCADSGITPSKFRFAAELAD